MSGESRAATTSPRMKAPAKLDELNDYNRHLYRDEVAGLVRAPERLPQGRANRSCTRRIFASTGRSASSQGRNSTPRRGVAMLGDKEVRTAFCRGHAHRRKTSKLLLEIIANEKTWIAEKKGRGIRSTTDRRAVGSRRSTCSRTASQLASGIAMTHVLVLRRHRRSACADAAGLCRASFQPSLRYPCLRVRARRTPRV